MGLRLPHYKFYVLQAEVLQRVNIIYYIKPLHVHVVMKPDESLSSVMTEKNDGHFGSVEHDHRCFTKGELAIEQFLVE